MAENTMVGGTVDVLAIAKAQKGILWCVAGAILIVVLGLSISQLFNLLGLPLIIVEIYFAYKLLIAFKSKYWILWLIGMLIPYFSLILLLVLNERATKVIRAQGYKVSLMGARLADIKAKNL
jgi:hypothetical protein